jgi:hypothetical protein
MKPHADADGSIVLAPTGAIGVTTMDSSRTVVAEAGMETSGVQSQTVTDPVALMPGACEG